MTAGPGRRVRAAWLLPLLVALVIGVPILEVWGIIAIGQRLGGLVTVGLLIATSLAGAWLMRREGSRAWRALVGAFNSGKLPAGELADAALVLVGGVLLMLPGFFTDVIGFFFLLPLTRPLARTLVGFVIARRMARAGVNLDLIRAKVERDTVIEGETVPDQPTPPKPDSDPTVIKGEIEP